jgi:hypothetical protein
MDNLQWWSSDFWKLLFQKRVQPTHSILDVKSSTDAKYCWITLGHKITEHYDIKSSDTVSQCQWICHKKDCGISAMIDIKTGNLINFWVQFPLPNVMKSSGFSFFSQVF